MISVKLRTTKVVARMLVFSLFLFYAQMSGARSTDTKQDTATRPPQTLGNLSTSGNRKILVDKNEADTGATILDGATLETPDCTTATVRLGPLTEIRLATNTIAVINYSADKVKVTLKQGCAAVLVGQSAEGTIETPDGKIAQASQLDASNRKRAEVCYPDGSKSDFTPSCIPIVFVVVPIGIGGLVTLAAVAVSSQGDNPSDSAP